MKRFTIAAAILFSAITAHAHCTPGKSYMLFTDSRGNIGTAGVDKLGDLLQADCPGSTVSASPCGGRGVYTPGVCETNVMATLDWMLNFFHPTYCLLMLGINDKFGYSPEEVTVGTKALGDECIAKGATPIIISGMPVGTSNVWMWGAWAGDLRHDQLHLADAIGWQGIDTWKLWGELAYLGACTNSGSGVDGIHPYNVTCRQQWADYVAAEVP